MSTIKIHNKDKQSSPELTLSQLWFDLIREVVIDEFPPEIAYLKSKTFEEDKELAK